MAPATFTSAWIAVALLFAQDAPADRNPLARRYREGEQLSYRMKGVNENWSYEIRAIGVVKKDSSGKYVEEYAWSDLVSNGAPFSLPPETVQFRQILSLDPDKPPSIPNLRGVHPTLIGPITDFLTFYADLWLAARTGKLIRTSDRFYQKHGTPASWADGNRVVLGEDSIDFDITLTELDRANGVAALTVRHVPPKEPQIKLPAPWMRTQVTDTPNNWVNVIRKDNTYIAGVGKETFDVQMKISLTDGKILSGSIANTVTGQERDCTDAAFMDCGAPRPRRIVRNIEISFDR